MSIGSKSANPPSLGLAEAEQAQSARPGRSALEHHPERFADSLKRLAVGAVAELRVSARKSHAARSHTVRDFSGTRATWPVSSVTYVNVAAAVDDDAEPGIRTIEQGEAGCIARLQSRGVERHGCCRSRSDGALGQRIARSQQVGGVQRMQSKVAAPLGERPPSVHRNMVPLPHRLATPALRIGRSARRVRRTVGSLPCAVSPRCAASVPGCSAIRSRASRRSRSPATAP